MAKSEGCHSKLIGDPGVQFGVIIVVKPVAFSWQKVIEVCKPPANNCGQVFLVDDVLVNGIVDPFCFLIKHFDVFSN